MYDDNMTVDYDQAMKEHLIKEEINKKELRKFLEDPVYNFDENDELVEIDTTKNNKWY